MGNPGWDRQGLWLGCNHKLRLAVDGREGMRSSDDSEHGLRCLGGRLKRISGWFVMIGREVWEPLVTVVVVL